MSQKRSYQAQVFSDDESYEVEKIVNHRFINGKKEYKVIWAGYSLEEATWQPEENLRCPEKIQDFQKRYEEVLKKKKLINTNQSPNNSQLKQSIPQQQRALQPQRVNTEKIQSIQQQKPETNPRALLNRERLQASLEKNNLVTPKKQIEIQSLKSKILNSQVVPIVNLSSDKLKIPIKTIQTSLNREAINTADIFGSSINNKILLTSTELNGSRDSLNGSFNLSSEKQHVENPIKSQKINQKTQNIENVKNAKIEVNRFIDQYQRELQRKPQMKENISQIRTKREVVSEMINRKDRQETKTNHFSDSDEMEEDCNYVENKKDGIFLKVSQKLQIEMVLGLAQFGVNEGERNEKVMKQTSSKDLVLIKNRFSEKQKLVEKQRIIREQAIKLIEFYQSLLMKRLGQ